jgi:hypothetical protein
MSKISPDDLLKPSVELPVGGSVTLHRKGDGVYGLDSRQNRAVVTKVANAVVDQGSCVSAHEFSQRLIVIGETASMQTLLSYLIGNELLVAAMERARNTIKSIEGPSRALKPPSLSAQLELAQNRARVAEQDRKMGLPAQRTLRRQLSKQEMRRGLHS